MKNNTQLRFLLIALGIFLLLALGPRWLQASQPEEDELQEVWQRVRQAGAYAFNADLTQTLTPLPTVKNAGRDSKESRIYLEGQTDLVEETLSLTMWSGGGSVLSPETGMQMKVKDGKAFARQGDQPWESIEDFSGTIAPGGDFLAYVAAAENVVKSEPQQQLTPSGEITYVRYTFDINGRRFAEYMRKQMTQQLAANGELPPGVTFDLPQIYTAMNGHGELWVGENGLPIHQLFELQFPETQDDHTISARAEVNFSNFQSATPVAAGSFFDQALGKITVNNPQLLWPGMWLLAVLVMVLVASLIKRPDSRYVHGAVALTVISSMLLTPLLTSFQVAAFQDSQLERHRESDVQEAQEESEAALFAPGFDPLANPLSKKRIERAISEIDTTTTTQTANNEKGLSSCTSNPSADDDGDKLTNLEECLLGTLPDFADTDQDMVDDYTEVNGFRMAGSDNTVQTWYSNPNDADSNRDGIADGKEWHLDANNDNLPDDTDGDGTPDLWDLDNDGDGVPDNLDLSPYYTSKGSQTFSGSHPFQLIVDDLSTGEIAKVEFQLTPTDADHLWYAMNVFDWPDNDQQGQIQDADGKTFFDLDPSLARSPNDNGDMRLIPMLEIEITGAPDNLPSTDLLHQFGIAVQKTSANTQVAYVPAQLVTDTTGEKNVAFYGRMYYKAASTWGNAQQVRLVWVVQALVDKCKTYKNNVCTEYSQYNDLQIVQTYDDEWTLTGLSVSEDKEAEMAIIYEDPAVANDAPLYMNTLYQLFYGLDHTFLAGADCDSLDSNGDCVGNGSLDFTVDEIARRFNHADNSSVSEEDRWGLDNVLTVSTSSYDSLDVAMMNTTITETKQVLDGHFTAAWSASQPITPTIMYAWQETYRGLNLDETIRDNNNLSWNGQTLTVNLPTSGSNPVQEETMVGVKWVPYVYNSATGWSAYDIESYWSELEKLLVDDFADSDYPATDQILGQLLYLSVYSSSIDIVKVGDSLVIKKYQTNSAPLAAKLTKGSGAGIKKIVKEYFKDSSSDLNSSGGFLALFKSEPESELEQTFSAPFFALKLARYAGGAEGEAVGILVMLSAIVAGVALFEKYALHSTNSNWSITAAVSVGAIMTYYSIFRPVRKAITFATSLTEGDEAISAGDALLETLSSSSKVVGASRVAGVVGLIIAIGVAIGIFLYVVASGKVQTGTIAFNKLIAETIAVIILAVVFFVLSTTLVGSILVGLISLIDILLILLGTGWTISGTVAEAIGSIVYQFDLTVDLDVTSGDLAMQLANEAAGISAGNHMVYTLPITTTLKQTEPRSQDALKSNSLVYALSEHDARDLALSTSLNDRSQDWKVSQYDTYSDPDLGSAPLYQATVVDHVSDSVPLSAGVNRETQLFVDSAYALNGLSCWVGFCSSKTVSGANSNMIGSAIVLDVFPATLDDFVNANLWSNGEVRLADKDGDGLLPYDAGGLDPDDSTWDADGDNLSDAYELTLRSRTQAAGGENLDPLSADTDGDTIQDDLEIRLATNPGNVDSDDDGLEDVAEIAPGGGWLLPYASDKVTRVWSSPLEADIDGDGMNDLFERTQDTCPECQPWANPDKPEVFNPNVWNESPIALYVSDNSTDGFVLPSTTFVYTTTAVNNLNNNMTIGGDLTLELPDAFSGGPLSTPIRLSSGFTETLVSTLTPDTSSSTSAVLTSVMNVTEFAPSAWAWDPQIESDITGSVGSSNAVDSAVVTGWSEGNIVATTLESAADGTNNVVVYLFNPDGSLAGHQTVATSGSTESITAPQIACNNAGICLVTWGSYDSSNGTAQAKAVRLHQSLNNPSLVTIATQEGGYHISPVAVASDGTDFMTAWGKPAPNLALEMWVRPVTGAGQITEPLRPIDGAFTTQGDIPPEVNLAWGGAFSSYIAAWEDGGEIWHARVSNTGIAGQRIYVTDGTGIFSYEKWTAPEIGYDPISQQMLFVYTEGSLNARRLSATDISEEIVLDSSSTVQNSDGMGVDIFPDLKNSGWIVSWSAPSDDSLSSGNTVVASTNYQALNPAGLLRGNSRQFTQNVPGSGSPPSPGLALTCFQPRSKLELNFEESTGAMTFVDDSGQGHDATCTGSTCPLAGETGRYGNGVFFNGAGEYLDTNSFVAQLGQADFTIEAWVKTDVVGATTEVAIVTKNDADGSWEPGEKSFYLDGSGKPTFVGWGNEYIYSNKVVNDGFWHHVVVVWDYAGSGAGGVGRMYVDGANVTASSSYAANHNDNAGDTLKIARPNFQEAPNYFSGSVDGIVVYDWALTTAEIRDAFDGAVAIYDLDEIAGSKAFVDASNSGFNATCSGSGCPTMGVDGVAYTAAQFDGTDDFLEIQAIKRAVEVFSYDFEAGAGSGWNRTNTQSATTANGSTHFLGTFGNETVTLDLSSLPAHDTVEVSFDLFLPGSWDGDRTDLGMDNWEWGAGGSQIFKSNFSNQADDPGNYQYGPANWCSGCAAGWWTNEIYGLDVYRDYDSATDECTGISQEFTADAPNLANEPIGNDTISCHTYVSDGDDTTGILYKDINYSGTAWSFDLKRGILPDFENDAISSIRVWPAAHAPKHGAIDDTLAVSGLSEGTIYHISHTISNHTADTLNLYFKGDTSSSDPERWGLDNVIVTLKSDSGSVPLTNSSFTLSAWVKPTSIGNSAYVISQGSPDTNQGLQFGFRRNLFNCGFWNDDLGAGPFSDTDWHHWACTYDAETNSRILYRDGIQIAQNTASSDYIGTGPTYIGKRLDDAAYFDGALDEVAIWTEALSADQVLELYRKVKVEDESVLSCLLARTADEDTFGMHSMTLRETTTALGTDMQSITSTIGIDADAPSATILAPSGGYVNDPDTLSVSGAAVDQTSHVEKVEVQLNNGAWETADGSESWQYTWNTNSASGDTLNVKARSTDILGHVGSSVSKSYVVDLDPPTVSFGSNAAQVRATRDDQGRWLVPLSGNVSDPAAGSHPGSGVSAVEVLLQGSQNVSGNGWQEATLNGGTWSIAYILPDHIGAGLNDEFTVALRATDVANNTTAQANYVTKTILVDAGPPQPTLITLDASTSLVTQTLTLNGMVTDTVAIDTVEINFTPAEQIDSLAGTILHLPFDETQDTQYFADQSGSGHPAVCTTCPAANQAGRRDQAVSFDGSDIVTVDGIDLANSSFTIATWAKRESPGVNSWLISQGELEIDHSLTLGLISTDKVICAFQGDYLETTGSYAGTDWHHWACTYDANTRLRTLYRDGVQIAQDTAEANYQGTGALHIGSLFDGTEPFNGLLDELTIHDRALAGYEVANLHAYGSGTWESAALNGTTNPTWTYTIADGTDGLEGIYQVNVRATDTLGNRTTLDGQRMWRGEIDTRPPVVNFTATPLYTGIVPFVWGTEYDCHATDFNLAEDHFCIGSPVPIYPGFQTGDLHLTNYDAVDQWYANTISDTTRLYKIDASHTYDEKLPTNVTVQTCDVYGHCTTSQSSLANNENDFERSASTDERTSLADDNLTAEIFTPANGTVLSSLEQIDVSGYAYALNALREITVTVNGESAFSQHWVTDNITNTLWSFQWRPPGQGTYKLQPSAGDWQDITPPAMPYKAYMPLVPAFATPLNDLRSSAARPAGVIGLNGVYTGPISTIYVDTEPPVISIDAGPVNMADQVGQNIVLISGTATDSLAIHRVEVRVDDGPWKRASFDEDGRWQAVIRLSGVLDGNSFKITARATDKADWTTTTERHLTVDIVPPAQVEIDLAYENAQGETLPTSANETLNDAKSLEMAWTAAADGSGIDEYLAGWSQLPTPDPDELNSYSAGETISQTAGEAQTWYAHVMVVDNAGNVRSQTAGPIYVDGPLTPDIVDDLRYQGWANEVCAIEGVDRRLAQAHPDIAGDAIQRFYTSWDADALRVSWHGANWNHEGDMFLYLDTRPGGADRLFNPYPADQETVLYLPGNTPDPTPAANSSPGSSKGRESLAANPVMGADLVVWVEDAHDATLYRWDGSAWQLESALDDSNYRFASGQGAGTTDLLLPFSLMNIVEPETAALGLLAVATEEDALGLWSTMPTRNPINSPRVVNPLAAESANDSFALVRAYYWDSLGRNLCPNGRLNSDGSGPTGGSFADSDLKLTLSSDPVGTTYNFMNDEMAWLWPLLFRFQNVPIVPSQLFDHMDTEHPLVSQGQTIHFTIDYANDGSETATGVQVELNSQFSLSVSEQVIDLGDIPPGTSGSYTFEGTIATGGLAPELQEWATLEAFVYDDQSPRDPGGGPWSSAPLEWMWSDHQVD